MSRIVNGSITVQQNEIFFSFKPFSGGEKGGVLEGLDEYIEPLVQPLLDLGYAVDYKKSQSYLSTIRYSGAFSSGDFSGGTITPTNPNADFKDTWELVRNTVQKELLESDHPLVQQLGATNAIILKNLISGSGPDVWTGDPATTFNNNPSLDYNSAAYLWALYQSGVRTIEVKQPILRLTRTTSQLYDTPFDVSKVDTLFNTASMIADSGVPSTFAVPLVQLADKLAVKSFPNPPYKSGIPDPPIVLRPYTADPAPHPAGTLILEYAWLKDIVGATKHGAQRITYNVDYKFGLYDVVTYGYAA